MPGQGAAPACSDIKSGRMRDGKPGGVINGLDENPNKLQHACHRNRLFTNRVVMSSGGEKDKGERGEISALGLRGGEKSSMSTSKYNLPMLGRITVNDWEATIKCSGGCRRREQQYIEKEKRKQGLGRPPYSV